MIRTYNKGANRKWKIIGGYQVFNVNVPAPTQKELNTVCPVVSLRASGNKTIAVMTANRTIRRANQIANGLEEVPFELVDADGGNPRKKSFMSEEQARDKNLAIACLGLCWRRAGY